MELTLSLVVSLVVKAVYWYYNNTSFLINMKMVKRDAKVTCIKENYAW